MGTQNKISLPKQPRRQRQRERHKIGLMSENNASDVVAALFAGQGVLLRILGGGVPSGSLNPDPNSDQNMPFSIRLYALAVPLKTIPDFRP